MDSTSSEETEVLVDFVERRSVVENGRSVAENGRSVVENGRSVVENARSAVAGRSVEKQDLHKDIRQESFRKIFRYLGI